MRALAILLAAALTAAVLGGPVSPAWAKLEGGDTCVLRNPAGGAPPTQTTVTGEVRNLGGAALDIYVTLRLERAGVRYFDRVVLAGVPTIFVPNNHIDFTCLWLPHEDNSTDPSVAALGDRIRAAFGIPATRNFCITDRSISGAEPLEPIPTFPGDPTTASSTYDVVIYAVDGPCTP